MSIDVDIVKQLIASGGAVDLHNLLMGVSPYCRKHVETATLDEREHELWTLAIHHLLFVIRFGRNSGGEWEDEIYHSAYLDEFQKWLYSGAPGLVEDDLNAYLHDHPIAQGGGDGA